MEKTGLATTIGLPVRQEVSLLKRFPAALVALAMAAAACGGDSQSDPTTTAPTTTAVAPAVTDAPATADSEPTTAAPATTTAESENRGPVYLQAATVNGEPIGMDDVTRLVTTSGDTMSPERFAQILASVILGRIMYGQAQSQLGIDLADEEVEAQIAALVQQSGLSREEFLEQNEVTEEGLSYFVGVGMLQDRIAEELAASGPSPTEEQLRQMYDSQPASYTEVCSAHILLESESEAQAALERAQAGEDFAALAMALSTGPSGPNGGDLGCSPASTYVSEFADATITAPLGEAVGPVQTQFGWHVILVSDRTVTSFEEARPALEADFGSDPRALWEEWWGGVITGAAVEVEPEYGQWTPQQPFVIPPTP